MVEHPDNHRVRNYKVSCPSCGAIFLVSVEGAGEISVVRCKLCRKKCEVTAEYGVAGGLDGTGGIHIILPDPKHPEEQ
jgi:transcription elongation factor Elf1